ncbi:DUF4412 domain-containing protein [Marixanthomonas spongiae]|uniref:Uncharacterized protein n=1 Tax=Marixanthomonas spongiae TaxID=2174845 RepID=A0A2U0HXI9_9FLAO|nr:DUF4412 domain-containing protein [Marixanthomonas spongiae]PVW13539.1 hypothetical protein DDV96_12845 [Marixanthomonas spongiae]
MKPLKTLLTVFFALAICGTTNAQFFKKLKKRAENAVERTVLNKTDREVSKTTDKTIDGVIKGDGKKGKTKTQQNRTSLFGGGLEGLPDAYEFEYVMDMTLTSRKKEEMTLQYYIAPNTSYFGNAMPNQKTNSVIVYDMENQAMITFMDNNGQKMAMRMDIPLEEEMQKMIEKSQNGENSAQNMANITPLPGKTILGYKCKGYLVKQEDGTAKIYITNEAPVSFVGMFANLEKMQKNMNTASIPFGKNSLMMEMEYTSNKRKRDHMHMICTSLEKKPFTIEKADYQGM